MDCKIFKFNKQKCKNSHWVSCFLHPPSDCSGQRRWLSDASVQVSHQGNCQQEAQLMLTNLGDALSGQSRSPNMVPFDMLGMVSY